MAKKKNIQVPESNAVLKGRAGPSPPGTKATGKDLAKYPLLVYAPKAHGEGIRTEDNGTPVEDIDGAMKGKATAEKVAAKFGTTVGHVLQALDYVRSGK